MDGSARRPHSPARLALMELMQRTHFGTIEELQIAGGEPVLSPPPRVIRHIKFGVSPKKLPLAGGALKVQLVDLFRQLDELADGTIACLEIQHGLPFRMTIQEL